MKKQPSMCARIAENAGDLMRWFDVALTKARRSSVLYLTIMVILLLGMLSIVPLAMAEDIYYPNKEDVKWGTRTAGVFPQSVRYDDDSYLQYKRVAGGGDLEVCFEWDDVPIGREILKFGYRLNIAGTIYAYAYNSSSSDWDRFMFLNETSWTDVRYELTYFQWNQSNPTIRFYIPSGVGTSALLEVDYLMIVDKLSELEDEIGDLERRIKELEKQIRSDNPVTVNQTNLPTVPHDTRGTLEYDTLFVDPYLVTVYDLLTFKTGSDLDFYLIYPSTSDEVTVIEDWIHIEETSYTRLWINDTVGGTELLNTTDAVGPFNLEYGYNITVQTSGASSSVRADRTSTVRLIDSFEWGESTQTGIFATTTKIENDLGFEDMSNVRIRWAFPTEDSDGRTVNIDMASVTVWDEDNNLELDRGRHFSLDESSVILELRWLNTSESRSFKIEFTRESFVETEEYYTVRDNDIAFSDAYGDAPFTTNIHFTASGADFREGKIIIRFDLTGKYAGEKLDVHTLKIKRSDSSLFQDYTYDSISNELRITDQSVDAGDSITYTLYWDWYTEKGALINLIGDYPLLLWSAMILIAFLGVLYFVTIEGWKKYLGLVAVLFDLIALGVMVALG